MPSNDVIYNLLRTTIRDLHIKYFQVNIMTNILFKQNSLLIDYVTIVFLNFVDLVNE